MRVQLVIEEKESIYAFHEIMKVIEDGNAD